MRRNKASRYFKALLSLSVIAISLKLLAQPSELSVNNEKTEKITLGKIKGRHWLFMPDGKPFFAHGITHARNLDANIDFEKFSKACKEVGFNAYGYGCPEPLRKDMPFIESWNHLVPISYYRGKNAVRFIDVFDTKV